MNRKPALPMEQSLNRERPLEIEYLLQELRNLTQKKHDIIYNTANLMVLRSLGVIEKTFFPWIKSLPDHPELKKKWGEHFFYDKLSTRFSSTTSSIATHGIQFVENNCPHLVAKDFDSLVTCLNDAARRLEKEGPAATLDREELRLDVETFVGMMAWYSRELSRYVFWDPDFRKFYPQVNVNLNLNGDASLEKIIKIFGRLGSELNLYLKNIDIRRKLNAEHLVEGWSIILSNGHIIKGPEGQGFFDKSAVAEFIHHYKSWMVPASYLLYLTSPGMLWIPYHFLMSRYIRPSFNAYKEIKIKLEMEKIQSLTHEEAFSRLSAETKSLRGRVKWMSPISTIVHLAALMQVLYYLFEFGDRKNIHIEEDASLIVSSLYNVMIVLYIGYVFSELMRKHCVDYMLQSNLKKHQANLNRALSTVLACEVEFYTKETLEESLFSIPIKPVEPLSIEEVDSIVQHHLKKHGHHVHSSFLFGEHKKIAITINEYDNLASLRLDIERSLVLEKHKNHMRSQLNALCVKLHKLHLKGQIGAISLEGNRIVGELIFHFMSGGTASQWKRFFSDQYQLSTKEIVQEQYQLRLKLALLEKKDFASVLNSIDEHKNLLSKKSFLTQDKKDKGKERRDPSSDSEYIACQKAIEREETRTRLNTQAKLDRDERKKKEAAIRAEIEKQKNEAAVARRYPN